MASTHHDASSWGSWMQAVKCLLWGWCSQVDVECGILAARHLLLVLCNTVLYGTVQGVRISWPQVYIYIYILYRPKATTERTEWLKWEVVSLKLVGTQWNPYCGYFGTSWEYHLAIIYFSVSKNCSHFKVISGKMGFKKKKLEKRICCYK